MVGMGISFCGRGRAGAESVSTVVSKRGRVGKDMTAGYAVPLMSRGGRSGAGGWVV